jgi:hypothetical protein
VRRRHLDAPQEAAIIALVRDANPVSRTARSERPREVEEFLLSVMERTDMVHDISTRETERVEHSQVPRWVTTRWAQFGIGLAVATLLAVPAFLLLGRNGGDLVVDPALEGIPALQAMTLNEVVRGVNEESFVIFRDQFADDGGAGFEGGLVRPYHVGTESGQLIPVSDPSGFEADFLWGADLDRRIELKDCSVDAPRIVSCEAYLAWGALRHGYDVTLGVAFSQSGKVVSLMTEPTEIDPTDGSQPMGFTAYQHFLDWLQGVHPDAYMRLVDPGTTGSINGIELTLADPPRNPDLVAEMTSLIDEYLATS